jgi:hypothetical protein
LLELPTPFLFLAQNSRRNTPVILPLETALAVAIGTGVFAATAVTFILSDFGILAVLTLGFKVFALFAFLVGFAFFGFAFEAVAHFFKRRIAVVVQFLFAQCVAEDFIFRGGHCGVEGCLILAFGGFFRGSGMRRGLTWCHEI